MIDKSRRGPSPLIGYSIQNQGCISPDHQTCLHLSNHNFNGYKDFHSPGLMTFKQFTLSQDDNLAPNELIEMYDSYKTKYVQKHQSEFLDNNRNSPIIFEKFHPIWIRKVVDERRNLVLKRIEVFSSKLKRGGFNTVNQSNNDVEKINHSNTISDSIYTDENDSITVFGSFPHFETDLKSHLMLLTDIPSYISYLDITKFFNNDFPLADGGLGKCNGFLDILLSPPKFTRGILNRQCYILFDNMRNRDSAIELIKGKTIKSSVTTNSILLSYNDTNNQMEDTNENEDPVVQQTGSKYSIYIIQAKGYNNENCSTKFGQVPKIFSTQERLSIDKNNMKKIIEKIESEQNISSAINEIMENLVQDGSMNIKAVVDVLSLYLKFVHGIDYYLLSASHPIQTNTYNPSNVGPVECLSDTNNTKNSNSSDTTISQEDNENSIKYNEKSLNMYNNLLFLSRGYIEILFKNKFRIWSQRDEGNVSEPQIYKGQLDDFQNQALLNQLEENVNILLNLPSIFDMIPHPIRDDDDSLSYSWKRYCEQHTLRKKADRWQCGKCLKQFKGEEFVHKHLAKKHKDFLETIREEITFERIIKPSAEKFPHLIYPTNADEFSATSVNRRGNHGNPQGIYRPRYNKHLRSNPYEKRRYFKDWDIPKQQTIINSSNDIRTSIKYDDL
ncbi:uncharacterized protein cubi_02302 [Cryptosporidium ubiquitum]|uniref:C2H2-type domain-containing protein n=1 Tax=Cryptosporidium ubiquitum TaxID=857276 RepID=A0A1J4MGD1_9CRYT|nr:uncharacterized protein cubi_02302 [Cryptosporidium ubiquitum]OII73071.1 hypothetical protein cubi_02302 [Cryptosporidium ubiquitum]